MEFANKDRVKEICNACRDGDLDRVKKLLAKTKHNIGRQKYQHLKYYYNFIVRYETHPLYLAAVNGHNNVVRFLVENGDNINHRYRCGFTHLNKGW